jgi:hypothetical protein
MKVISKNNLLTFKIQLKMDTSQMVFGLFIIGIIMLFFNQILKLLFQLLRIFALVAVIVFIIYTFNKDNMRTAPKNTQTSELLIGKWGLENNWQFTFNPGGSFVLADNQKHVFKGRWQRHGNTLTITLNWEKEKHNFFIQYLDKAYLDIVSEEAKEPLHLIRL